MMPRTALRFWSNGSRRRHILLAVVTAVSALGLGSGVAAAAGAFATSQIGSSKTVASHSTTPRASASHPGPTNPPPPQTTLGPELSSQTVLTSVTSQFSGVSDSAIQTAPYEAVASALDAAGAPPVQSLSTPTWTPVPKSDPVDVVAMTGNLMLQSGQPCSWIVMIVNPTSGAEIAQAHGPQGTWPTSFNTLPAYSAG
jgi:hypothetical protein